MPGNKRHKGLEALVAIDESGSISDSDIMTFYNELRIIQRVTKAKISVTRFDTDCTDPVPLERYMKTRERMKRGGTDFRPLFKLADSISARLVLVFTDGDGIMPENTKQKVLWVQTGGGSKKFPFGETVLFSERCNGC